MVSKEGQRARLLVIHEDLILARSLEGQFQKAGFSVKIAGSVGHALWLMEDDIFEIVMLVFDSPPLRDLIVLHRLREKQPGIRLMVYGLVRTQAVMNYLTRAGVDLILNRTVGIDEVLNGVERLLPVSIKYQDISGELPF